MKFLFLASPMFHEALHRLLQAALPAQQAYNLSRISGVIEAENTRYNDLRIKLLNSHARKDESGKLLTDPAGQAIFEEGKLSEFQVELKELQDIEFDLPCSISLELIDIRMSAQDVGILMEAGILSLSRGNDTP